MDLLLNAIQEVVGFERAVVWLPTEDGAALRTSSWIGFDADLGGAPVHVVRLDGSVPLLEEAFRSGEERVLDQDQPVPERWRARGDAATSPLLRSRAPAVLPLVSRGRTVGVLAVDNPYSRKPLEDKLPALRRFATSAAVAIDSAQLYEDVQRELVERRSAEAELRRSEERYRTILDTIQDAYFEIDAHGVLKMVNPAFVAGVGESLGGSRARARLPRLRGPARRARRSCAPSATWGPRDPRAAGRVPHPARRRRRLRLRDVGRSGARRRRRRRRLPRPGARRLRPQALRGGAARGQGGRRGGQRVQERVPGERLARAADAAHVDPRLREAHRAALRGRAGARARGPSGPQGAARGGAGADERRHHLLRVAAADAPDQRRARPGQDRGRPRRLAHGADGARRGARARRAGDAGALRPEAHGAPGGRCARGPARPGGRPRPADAGGDQPDLERGQVHRRPARCGWR